MKIPNAKVCDICKKKLSEGKCEICNKDLCEDCGSEMNVSSYSNRLIFFVKIIDKIKRKKAHRELKQTNGMNLNKINFPQAIMHSLGIKSTPPKPKEPMDDKEGVLLCDNCLDSWNKARQDISDSKRFLKKLCKIMKDEIIIDKI